MVHLYVNPDGKPTQALDRERFWNLVIQIILFLALVGTSTGFGIYADQNRKARTCPLVYDKTNGAVTEAQMRTWVSDTDSGWTLTSPTWDDAVGACACDVDPDPKNMDSSKKTPVWIAPCDLKSLFPAGTWPADFVKVIDDQGKGCLPKDHVKVCLARADLERLWTGDPTTTNGVKHCHDEGPPLHIYTGWDGGLYCAKEDDLKPWCYDYWVSEQSSKNGFHTCRDVAVSPTFECKLGACTTKGGCYNYMLIGEFPPTALALDRPISDTRSAVCSGTKTHLTCSNTWSALGNGGQSLVGGSCPPGVDYCVATCPS